MKGLLRLLRRNLARRPGRALLTLFGSGAAIFLFVAIDSLGAGLERALAGDGEAATLIVYRQNRYCPLTSVLPESYVERIRRVPGVRAVLPVQVALSSCRASLDLVSFAGAPAEDLIEMRRLEVVEGDAARFARERDAALVGRAFAERRGLQTGDSFRFAGVDVKVAGIVRSPDPVNEGLVFTHLEFLQRSSRVNRPGSVTQFEVQVADAGQAEAVALKIDELFSTAEAPTATQARTAHLARASAEVRELLRFARRFGAACVAVLLVLVANTLVLAVHERAREFGILLAMGYRGEHVALLVVGEALAIGLAGGALGLGAALVLILAGSVSVGVEGVPIQLTISAAVVGRGVLVAVAAAALAALVPALSAARTEVVRSLGAA
ncbi:MAG: ABC transporter permease [Planctomycetes bacterium]|nr:ABC transporter permease [Planctomycetota bacterium]